MTNTKSDSMNSKGIFSLAVRLLGLYFLFLAIASLPVTFVGQPAYLSVRVILNAAFYAGVSWWMIGGASSLVNRAYPTESSSVGTNREAFRTSDDQQVM
jgi:glucan phosphoethanolaminetransferase (alkaline phosphatase superfamily)